MKAAIVAEPEGPGGRQEMTGDVSSMDAADAARRLDWRLMLPVFLVVSLDAASSGAILPILPFYLREMGATPLVLGLVLGAEALSQFVAAPFLGQLSDRFGRRQVLLASQAGAVLSLSLLAVANGVVFILLARVLLGLTAANFSAAAAYAADNSSSTTRRQAIGVLSAGLGLGGIIGPSLSSYLSDIELTAPIYAALALSTISTAATAIWLKGGHAAARSIGEVGEAEAVRQKVSFRSILASPVIRVLVIALLCHYFAYGMFSSQLAVFLGNTFAWNGHAFGPKELGYILTADGTINIVVQLFLLRWLGRYFTERNLIVLIFGILVVGYLIAGMATGIAALALAVLCVSSGVALARPTFVAALSVHVGQQRQGVVMGTAQSLVAVTDIVSPVLAGFVVGQALYGAWIGAIVAIGVIGGATAYCLLPRLDVESAAR
jgi:DHA1 family tetracycline resistance protein-like MFS transporter